MENRIEEILKGRKTFFIVPDRSLLPQSYLEEYLNRDYECYFIDNELHIPLENKVEAILSIFDDALIFINIDSQIQHLQWARFIQKLTLKYKKALIGILYAKRLRAEEKSAIEKLYLYAIGIQGGCIQLEYQKKNNFGIIEKTLYANQAMGRRKSVRALCQGNCSFEIYSRWNSMITGKLNDISVSHFSITITPEEYETLGIKDFEKLSDINLYVHGLHFRTDAILFMQRETAEGVLLVFAFVEKDGRSGLDTVNRQLLVPKLYEILHANTEKLLAKAWKITVSDGFAGFKNLREATISEDDNIEVLEA